MIKSKFLLLAALAITVLSSCGGGKRELPKNNEYPVITISAANAQMKTTYPATIKGIQDVEVRPKVSGFITKLYVHEGEAVRAGQVLFVVDNAVYQSAVRQAEATVASAQSGISRAQASVVQAAAALNSAQAQAATAQLTYNNSKNLYSNKVIGDYEMQAAKNTYETAQAAVSQARSGVQAANSGVKQAEAALKQAQAGLATAKENLSFCYVKSPANGFVGSLPYKEGALVSPSSPMPVTTISNISTMEVYFSMTEADVLALSRNNRGLGNAINKFPKVSLQLVDGSIYNHEGTIVKTSGMIDATTGTISVIARFPNPEHLLKSGGSGKVVIAKNDNNALMIPQDATVQVQDKIFVYKVDANGKIHYSEIKVDPQNDGVNYVVTSGLKIGERIVSKGLATLQDGMEIKPLTPAQYEEALKKAAQLGENQSSASGFLKAMKGNDDKK
ncbi:efflux RND transporter periplasmic adaptor subunit [Prevotella intermedia]|uniref:Efflux transporter periplasmic adaptor subunit n=1 Tax=Prevotella intermedia TaxID=28131 RepID=A0A2A6EG08_PREIN|nr:efflux RND transporter periplasmic adaptor subunit [Prevotella intermedia]PDP60414.1 efflux transporter periplasmic adaptor subunit [Prevotella intermedia]